jgi:xanthine/uracil permease
MSFDMNSLNPLLTGVAILLGSILSPVLGWARNYLNNRAFVKAAIRARLTPPKATPEASFDYKQLIASGIIGIVAALITIGSQTGITSVSLHELEITFVAGFGADKLVKNAIGL